MKILTLDFESYYDSEYSLRKMSPAEYILDDRYECTGLAVKRGKDKSFWVEGDEVAEFFANEPTDDVMCVSHNALFDMCITAWRYGWIPKLMVDTMGVSRALLQHLLRSVSLDAVAKHLGLGAKTKALASVKGMRLEQIRSYPALYEEFKEYGLNDADLCYGIFEKLVASGEFPAMEIAVMDIVLRCCVKPQFVTDKDILYKSLAGIQQIKNETLTKAMLVGASGKPDLMSNDKFAELLKMHGVEPPMKISATTGKWAFAFAKTDKEFVDLAEHDSVAVQALIAARLDHKTTIEETRHERFINIANLNWPVTLGSNLMPMPLRYGAAHTHRLGGDWKMNVQNLGRDSMLRQALVAPEGHVVIAGDESQIEARITATLCGQEDMRQQFENGEDVYSIFATDLFGHHVDKRNKMERWMGKTCILGLGFGLGDVKFTEQVPMLARNQLGIDMPYTSAEGKAAVTLYRGKNLNIAGTWKLLNKMGISTLASDREWQFGPVLFRHEEIVLPNGMKLYYHNLRQEPGGRFGMEWVFDYGYKRKRIYGGKLLENIVQSLARIVVMEAAVRIRRHLFRLGIEIALQVHDELVFVVRAEHEQVVRFVLRHELTQRPWWMPALPLACEIESGANYGVCK
jgi:hypothetical protein